MSVPFESHVYIPTDVLISKVDGESVLLNLRTECYFGLDEVGTSVWEAIRSGDSIQRVYETVLSQYHVDPIALRVDLTELLDDLIRQGLVEIAPI